MKSTRNPFLSRLGLALVVVVALGGGYYLARYQLWTAYRNWSFARMNTMAEAFVAADDPRSALLTVRKVLRKRPNDVTAWRIGVQAALRQDSVEAVYLQRNLNRVERTPANQLELLRLAVKYQVYPIALETIPAVGAEGRSRAEYHRLAAEAYRGVGRELSAKYHLVSLLSLEPGDAAADLALAEIEFESDPVRLPATWAGRVRQRMLDPTTEVAATLLWLREGATREADPELRRLAAALETNTTLSLKQRFEFMAALKTTDPVAAERMLVTTQAVARDQSDDVVRVMEWLASEGRSDEIRAWFPVLSEAIQKSDPVRLAQARALDQTSDWSAVSQILAGPRWVRGEGLRMALLARAHRMSGRQADFAESWKLALIASGTSIPEVIALLDLVKSWQWRDERIDVLWKLFNLVPTSRMVRDELVAFEFRRGNTVNLNKIFARVIDADPTDDDARNNFAYTSLLLGTNPGRAQQIARDLHLQNPSNVSYLTTYSLAMHRRGESAAALALVETISGVDRATPSTMLQEATYAAASGRTERAAELWPLLARARMLPEERSLADGVGMVVTRSAAGSAAEVAMVATPKRGGTGWLVWLTERSAAPGVALTRADALYREERWLELETALRGESWRDDEHLRLALLAWVQRSQTRVTDGRDAWRQATAAAGREGRRLKELETLAQRWAWADERMDVLARRFEREGSDPEMLAGLLEYYRKAGRTTDMARMLWIHVNETRSSGTPAALCVYYSLLCDLNLSATQTLARRVFDATPAGAAQRVAYAFALVRQQRAAEALPLLMDLPPGRAGDMQVALVEAAALVELGRMADAQDALRRFTAVDALPEEISLAEMLKQRAVPGVVVSALTAQSSDRRTAAIPSLPTNQVP